MPRMMTVTLFLLTTCSTPSTRDWIEGGLYSTRNDDGTFGIIKILKLDDQGVHVRVYSNRFDSHPATLDESTLYMTGMDGGPGEGLGMGHLPLSKSSFSAWRPRFIKAVDVSNDELEGYEMWLEAKGGYF
jgi:hypothetical protein